MPDEDTQQQQQATPPATSGGSEQTAGDTSAPAPAIDVDAITRSVSEAAAKAASEQVQARIEELAKDQKVLADTIAAEKPGLTAELAAKAVNDALAGREQAQQAKAERQATIDRIVAEKLGGDADLAKFITGDDEQQLAASADALAAKLKSIKPDFGGAAKAGGTPPASSGDRSFRALLR